MVEEQDSPQRMISVAPRCPVTSIRLLRTGRCCDSSQEESPQQQDASSSPVCQTHLMPPELPPDAMTNQFIVRTWAILAIADRACWSLNPQHPQTVQTPKSRAQRKPHSHKFFVCPNALRRMPLGNQDMQIQHSPLQWRP